MAEAKITINEQQLKSIRNKLNRFNRKAISRRTIEVTTKKVKDNILLRTHGGKDVNFSPFKSYNPAYAAIEGKTIVNLTRSGLMLGSMTQKAVSDTKGIIFFSNETARKRAEWHNRGEGNLPKREFFGINIKDERLAVKTYQNEISKAIRRGGLK